jgi:hypothetical protein
VGVVDKSAAAAVDPAISLELELEIPFSSRLALPGQLRPAQLSFLVLTYLPHNAFCRQYSNMKDYPLIRPV